MCRLYKRVEGERPRSRVGSRTMAQPGESPGRRVSSQRGGFAVADYAVNARVCATSLVAVVLMVSWILRTGSGGR